MHLNIVSLSTTMLY